MRLATGLFLALISTVALNWSLFAQHRATSSLPTLSLTHPLASLKDLFTDRGWLLGYGIGIGGWALYIAALALAPLSLVQAVAAGGIGVLALAVRLSRRAALGPGETGGTIIATVGLVLLLVTLSSGHSAGRTTNPGELLALLAGLVVLGAVLAHLAASRLGRGPALGALAGILYAAGDIATKGALGRGALELVPALLICHVTGFALLQLSFQRTGALSSAGVATLFMNALPIVAGILWFHEALPGSASLALRIVAFVLVVVGAAMLAAGERVRTSSESAA